MKTFIPKNKKELLERLRYYRTYEPGVSALCDHLEWCQESKLSDAQLTAILLPMLKLLEYGDHKRRHNYIIK